MRFSTALSVAALLVGAPRVAHAQSSAPPAAPPEPYDTLSGHVAVSASAALAVPLGSLDASTPQSRLLGVGPGFGLELGYGVSHSLMVGLWGQYASFGAGSDCSSCSTRSLAGGPFVAYHLVQGVRFDPWMSAGLGYRADTISMGGSSVSYSGIEWLRLEVGGDWYASSQLGVGPFLELDTGAFTSRPANTDGALNWHFLAGARVTFDLPGK
jgi:hypothetical protein